MSNLKDQNCPLCEQKATFNFDSFALDKCFNCPNCTEYIISTRAEEKLKASSGSVRKELSEMAKNTKTGFGLLIKLEGADIVAIPISRDPKQYQ